MHQVELGFLPQLHGEVLLLVCSVDENYKVIGLGLLSSLPDLFNKLHLIANDALEQAISSLRIRSLSLLHGMMKEINAQIIVINILYYLKKKKEVRLELGDRIMSIASKFSHSSIWFTKIMEELMR